MNDIYSNILKNIGMFIKYIFRGRTFFTAQGPTSTSLCYNKHMNVQQALKFGIEKLNKAKIKNANREALILLKELIGNKITDYKYEIPSGTLKKYTEWIKRRSNHEPVAYITGHKEFFGLNFTVNKNVLIPRPETETLVEECLKLLGTPYFLLHTSSIIDMGTGSGCIAVSIARNIQKRLPAIRLNSPSKSGRQVEIVGIDTSQKALRIAKENTKKNKVTIKFIKNNLLKNIKLKKPTIIVANLPYVRRTELKILQPEIKNYEPSKALDGGKDGLDIYRKLFKQLSKQKNLIVLLIEIDPRQKNGIKKMTKKYLPEFSITFQKDLASRLRVAILSRS